MKRSHAGGNVSSTNLTSECFMGVRGTWQLQLQDIPVDSSRFAGEPSRTVTSLARTSRTYECHRFEDSGTRCWPNLASIFKLGHSLAVDHCPRNTARSSLPSWQSIASTALGPCICSTCPTDHSCLLLQRSRVMAFFCPSTACWSSLPWLHLSLLLWMPNNTQRLFVLNAHKNR